MLTLLSMKIQCGNKITKKLKYQLVCKFLKKLSHKRYFPALLVRCGQSLAYTGAKDAFKKNYGHSAKNCLLSFSKGGCLETQADQKSLS